MVHEMVFVGLCVLICCDVSAESVHSFSKSKNQFFPILGLKQ